MEFISPVRPVSTLAWRVLTGTKYIIPLKILQEKTTPLAFDRASGVRICITGSESRLILIQFLELIEIFVKILHILSVNRLLTFHRRNHHLV